jgi:hypothetical protein
MITIDDILNIDNCEIYTYRGHTYRHNNNYPIDEHYPPHEVWVDLDYPISCEISYSDLHTLEKYENAKELLKTQDLFLVPKYLQYGDYDSSCMVERSNQKIFLEAYENEKGVFSISGDYGSSGIAISVKYLLNSENEKAEEILNILHGLNNYPCLDDEDMSNMEYEAYHEAMTEYGTEDCMKALSEKLHVDVYDYDEKKFEEFLDEKDSHGNPSWIIESGGGCYIEVDKMIEGITFDQVKPFLIDYEEIS